MQILRLTSRTGAGRAVIAAIAFAAAVAVIAAVMFIAAVALEITRKNGVCVCK